MNFINNLVFFMHICYNNSIDSKVNCTKEERI